MKTEAREKATLDEVTEIIEERIYDVISLFSETPPPSELIKNALLSDDNVCDLQDWLGENLREKFSYSTSIDIIDSAWNIAVSDFRNGSSFYSLSDEAKNYINEITPG